MSKLCNPQEIQEIAKSGDGAHISIGFKSGR
jgi:hypothetical protein